MEYVSKNNVSKVESIDLKKKKHDVSLVNQKSDDTSILTFDDDRSTISDFLENNVVLSANSREMLVPSYANERGKIEENKKDTEDEKYKKNEKKKEKVTKKNELNEDKEKSKKKDVASKIAAIVKATEGYGVLSTIGSYVVVPTAAILGIVLGWRWFRSCVNSDKLNENFNKGFSESVGENFKNLANVPGNISQNILNIEKNGIDFAKKLFEILKSGIFGG